MLIINVSRRLNKIVKALLDHFDELAGIKKPQIFIPKKDFNTPQNLDKFIDKYFERAKGVVKIDREGVTVKILDTSTVFIKRSDLIKVLHDYAQAKGTEDFGSPMVIWKGFGIKMRTKPHDFLTEVPGEDFWTVSVFYIEENIYDETIPFTVIEEADPIELSKVLKKIKHKFITTIL
jgi:hypothetical protein